MLTVVPTGHELMIPIPQRTPLMTLRFPNECSVVLPMIARSRPTEASGVTLEVDAMAAEAVATRATVARVVKSMARV